MLHQHQQFLTPQIAKHAIEIQDWLDEVYVQPKLRQAALKPLWHAKSAQLFGRPCSVALLQNVAAKEGWWPARGAGERATRQARRKNGSPPKTAAPTKSTAVSTIFSLRGKLPDHQLLDILETILT